jgi:hypothetical protein
MSSAELCDVAWDLVEHGRVTLTIAELNAVFVRLGVVTTARRSTSY